MSSIKARCPYCSKSFRLPSEHLGRKAKCPCGQVFVVEQLAHPETYAVSQKPIALSENLPPSQPFAHRRAEPPDEAGSKTAHGNYLNSFRGKERPWHLTVLALFFVLTAIYDAAWFFLAQPFAGVLLSPQGVMMIGLWEAIVKGSSVVTASFGLMAAWILWTGSGFCKSLVTFLAWVWCIGSVVILPLTLILIFEAPSSLINFTAWAVLLVWFLALVALIKVLRDPSLYRFFST